MGFLRLQGRQYPLDEDLTQRTTPDNGMIEGSHTGWIPHIWGRLAGRITRFSPVSTWGFSVPAYSSLASRAV